MTTYNTGNPIGSTEVKDLYDNAQNFDMLSTTTTLESVPDRLGVPRMSLHGFEAEAKRRFESIKFQPPIPYAPGIEVTTSSLTVDYLGVLYYALPSALPFTTGAWNPSQWSPLQNTYPGNELLIFDDYAAASAAAATLPEGQVVEVLQDEMRDGASSRYSVQSGALVFKKNLDRLRDDLINPTGDDPVGGFDSAEKLRSYTGSAKVAKLSLHGFVHEMYLDEADTTTPDDGVIVVAAANGGRWKKPIDGPICANWYGAKPTISTPEQAAANTEAFRRACKSYKADWEAWATVTRVGRNVYATPGDYCLSNGFTVPKGCHFDGGGLGVVRLKVLSAHEDANPKLPVVSLGRVIDGTATAQCTGAYVVDPPPSIDAVYLNPQNSGIGLDISGVPGFKVGNIWAQADIAVNASGSGDGVFGDLFLEDSTGIGVAIKNCQNLIFTNIYTFVCNNPVVFIEDNNNIDIGTIQANYTKVAVIQANDGANLRRVNVEKVVCNQNMQYSTFTSVVRLRSNSSDLRIGTLDARNHNGWAFNNETGLSNSIEIENLILRQTPNNPVYTTGNEAKGFRVNNCRVRIGRLDVVGLAGSPFVISGTFAKSLDVSGKGFIGAFTGSTVVEYLTGLSGSTEVNLENIENNSGKPLFPAVSGALQTFKNIIRPFPIVSESSRFAIKIPFNGTSSSYVIDVRANTVPSGNALYSRIAKYAVFQETAYSSNLTTYVSSELMSKGAAPTDYVPLIEAQVDIDSVGGGSSKVSSSTSQLNTGYIVFSVPNSYTNVEFKIS